MKKIAIKCFTIFLVIMFLCTVISRVADSLTVAKVTAETASAKKIEHIVEAEGMVEKNRELAVLTESDLLVKTVYVGEGEKVEENAVLAEIDVTQLEEVMQGIRNEIKVMELQNQQAKKTEENAQTSKETSQNRAKEDYNRTVQENSAMLQKAQKELEAAKEALNAYQKTTEKQITNKNLQQTQSEGEAKEKSVSSENSQATPTLVAQSQVSEESQLESLQAEIKRAQEAYDSAKTSYEQALREAVRQVEDAENALVSQDASVEVNNISIEEKKGKLEKLEKIRQAEGKITAPVSGVITQSFLSVGQKTTDTACFTMADISSGMRFVAEICKEDAKYVQVGSKVTLKTAGNSMKDLKVESLEKNEDNENLKVTVLLTSDKISIGDSATMTVINQSELYDTAVPYSAIHSEDDRNYIYVAEQEETILGKEYIARAIEVEILDKNEKYAALSAQAIDLETKIIIDSDRYIEAGSRVRLQNP